MKIGGVQAERGGELPPLIFRRGEKRLVIRVAPVHDLDEFHTLVPRPNAENWSVMTKAGWQPDFEHPAFLEALKVYRKRRSFYMLLKSLEPSQIEWNEVRFEDPSTWELADKELAAVFSFSEIDLISDAIQAANNLSPEIMEAERETFFRERAAAQASGRPSPTGDPSDTKSSAPANGLESFPPESSASGTT